MAQELKHVGRVKSTNKKCLVAYRTLPGESASCLVVPTENLPDIYHDAIINLVESNAGQTAYEFAEALDRTQFPDGSRMLPALHSTGRLVKLATKDVEMTPTPSVSIMLSELNQIIAEQRGVAVDDLALTGSDAKPEEKIQVQQGEGLKTTSASVNETEVTSTPASFDSPDSEAKFYRSQADKLSKQAADMRRKAEELAPTKKKV